MALTHTYGIGSFLLYFLTIGVGFPGGSTVKNLPAKAGEAKDTGLILGSGRFLEEGMATQSSILAWRIPWTEELGLQSKGPQRVEYDCSDLAHTYAFVSVCVCVCVCTLHLLYPFICQWTFMLFPCLGYCK